jgi:triosephosphate isomerase
LVTRLRTPILIINFKNYSEVQGEGSLRLASTAENVARRLSVEIGVAPPSPFLALISKSVAIPVLSQHTDHEKPGGTTGALVPEVLKSAGAVGSLVNHSEKRLEDGKVGQVVQRLKYCGLFSVVCAQNPQEVSKYATLSPDFIAIEPPELIGSGTAVSKAQPDIITDSIHASFEANPQVRVICGAGIVNGEDVDSALRLGAFGVLVASGIIKSNNWESKISELAAPMTKTIGYLGPK